MMATVGKCIQRARKGAGLTQQALADALGVNKGTVWSWENDRFDEAPSGTKLAKIAELCGCEVGDLFPGASGNTSAAAAG